MSCQFVGHFLKSHRSTKMFYRHCGRGPFLKKSTFMPFQKRDRRDMVSISGSGRSSGGGHGNPLQYFRLENPMDREESYSSKG